MGDMLYDINIYIYICVYIYIYDYIYIMYIYIMYINFVDGFNPDNISSYPFLSYCISDVPLLSMMPFGFFHLYRFNVIPNF